MGEMDRGKVAAGWLPLSGGMVFENGLRDSAIRKYSFISLVRLFACFIGVGRRTLVTPVRACYSA